MRLLSGSLGARKWAEPRIGRMLAAFVDREGWRPSGEHLLSESQRHVFIAGVRGFVTSAAAARFPQDPLIIVKEPAGSAGAPLISEAVPESRLIAVVRDLPDVVASSLDGKQPGGWQNPDGTRWQGSDPLAFTEQLTRVSVNNIVERLGQPLLDRFYG